MTDVAKHDVTTHRYPTNDITMDEWRNGCERTGLQRQGNRLAREWEGLRVHNGFGDYDEVGGGGGRYKCDLCYMGSGRLARHQCCLLSLEGTAWSPSLTGWMWCSDRLASGLRSTAICRSRRVPGVNLWGRETDRPSSLEFLLKLPKLVQILKSQISSTCIKM